MNKVEKIQSLRQSLGPCGPKADPQLLSLGTPDGVLGGGLVRGTLHEIHARDWSAGGFAACLALGAARTAFGAKGGPLFWIRPDHEAREVGALCPQGLAELGGAPEALFLIRTANAAEALAAASDILACPHAGAVLLELSGNPKALDMVASRRLHFLAAANNVTVILLQKSAQILPSAAQTRWQVCSAPSQASEWGRPNYAATLLRNRMGATGHWHLAWDIEHGLFRDGAEPSAQVAGDLAAAFFDRPAPAHRRIAI